MDSADKPDMTKYIILEVLLGLVLGIVFLIIIWDNNSFWGRDYLTGLFKLCGILSLIFFIAVFTVGLIGAFKFKLSNKISKAIFYSVIYWLSSLIAVAVLANFLYIFSAYFMLAGIIVGFNHGLRHKSKDESGQSEIPS
jgi:hypothetical protein